MGNYVKKAKADVEKMKIVNPVEGAIKEAKKHVQLAKIEHDKDVVKAHKAADAAAVAATKYDGTADGTGPKAAAAASALKKADLHFHQMIALAHLSKMEVLDAESDLRKHQRTF